MDTLNSTIPLNGALIYELALLNSSKVAYRIAASSADHAKYFIEVGNRILRDMKNVSRMEDLDVSTHSELDAYRKDIHHDINRTITSFITSPSEEINILAFEEWYGKNKKRLRHVKDHRSDYIFAVGPYLVKQCRSSKSRLCFLGSIDGDIVAIGRNDAGMITVMDDQGIVYYFDGEIIVRTLKSNSEKECDNHQLLSVFIAD